MRVERNLMRKRISLLFAALMLALTMSFGGAAFAHPGGSENSCGASNPNIGVPAGPPENKGDEFFDCGLRNNPHGGPPGQIKKF
jgi:hypothetical protein